MANLSAAWQSSHRDDQISQRTTQGCFSLFSANQRPHSYNSTISGGLPLLVGPWSMRRLLRAPIELPPQGTAPMPDEPIRHQANGFVQQMQVEGESRTTRQYPQRSFHPTQPLKTGSSRRSSRTKPGGDPVEHAWVTYNRSADEVDGDSTRKGKQKAKARQFTESFERFLNAADFLCVPTTQRFRCLGISRRTYFYWVRAVSEERLIRSQSQPDYGLWLVWKSLEVARLKHQSNDDVRLWFSTSNPQLSNAEAKSISSGLRPIDLLFGYDIRRRPRVLRILLDMPHTKR